MPAKLPTRRWTRRAYDFESLGVGDTLDCKQSVASFRSLASKWFRGRLIDGKRVLPYKGPPRDYMIVKSGVKGKETAVLTRMV